MDGISRSRGWDKEIPHGVLLMEQLVLSNKWARNSYPYSNAYPHLFLTENNKYFDVFQSDMTALA